MVSPQEEPNQQEAELQTLKEAQAQVKKLQQENNRLRKENNELSVDQLTGLLREEPAKKKFLEMVAENPDILKGPVSVIAVDIMDLKITNDTYGHDAGDLLLKKFANYMKKKLDQKVDSGNFSGWIGFRFFDHGDEFGFILIGADRKIAEDLEFTFDQDQKDEVPKILITNEKRGVVSFPIRFRMGSSSTNGDEETQAVRAIQTKFTRTLPQAAEILRYLKAGADVKERIKKQNA